MQAQSKSKKEKKHVQWDEEQLKESQKYRGTFEKIMEPKTPYHKNSQVIIEIMQSDQQSVPTEQKSQEEIELQASLTKAKQNTVLNSHRHVNIAELNERLKEELNEFNRPKMEDQEQQQRIRRQDEFKKKRNAHYNEFKRMQQMKQSQWESPQEDIE